MGEEIELHKTETRPEYVKEDKKRKKEEFVKEKGTTKEEGINWRRKQWRGFSNLVEFSVRQTSQTGLPTDTTIFFGNKATQSRKWGKFGEKKTSQHLVEEELTESDGDRGPDQGGGQRSPNLVENMNSQHLVEEELTASD